MADENTNLYPNPEFEAQRARVNIQPGALVEVNNTVYRIKEILDFESIIGVDVETDRSCALRIQELRTVSGSTSKSEAVDLNEITEEDWAIANVRFAAIQPLLANQSVGRSVVEQRAQEIGVDAATLYRWLERYRGQLLLSSLIPQKRGWKEGKVRINESTEKVISEVIDTFYLTSERPSIKKTIQEINNRCAKQGIKQPGMGTVRSRIRNLSEKKLLRGRGFSEKAQNKYTPVPGRFPGADYPLAYVLIDHTPVDAITVDDEHRMPIERAWITVAIDAFSRMIVGYYLSYDAPSATSIAMCVAHMAIPKDEWLILHNVEAQWPVWGLPRTIHVDNASEFRSVNFSKACTQYGINLEFRPIKVPRYGGHIERWLGTFNTEIHELPGSTFSSVAEREGYDSEKHSAMTLSELETWLVDYICNVYHRSKHSSIGMTPLKMWEIGIFGNGERPGTGLPAKPNDRMRLLLDFLPHFERTVQTTGIELDGLFYYDEALRPWINALDDNKKKKKFTIRRDPRDISCIWFFDPVLDQYFRIPFADLRLPSMSIWEHKQAKQKLKKIGDASVDNEQLREAVERLRGYVEKAKVTSKKARRQHQRRREHEKGVNPVAPLQNRNIETTLSPSSDWQNSQLITGDIDGFGEIA